MATQTEAATWHVYLSNGIETHTLPQRSREAANETARICRQAIEAHRPGRAIPAVWVRVVCVPEKGDA